MTTGSGDNNFTVAMQNINMNNNAIQNLKDSVNEQDAVTRKQGYRIGEYVISPISNLNSIYSYLLKCENQVFNTTIYSVLFSRLNTNQLKQGYTQLEQGQFLVYQGIPDAGIISTRLMALTWGSIFASCDEFIVQAWASETGQYPMSMQTFPTSTLQIGNNATLCRLHIHNTLTFNLEYVNVVLPNNTSENYFNYATSNNISGANIKIKLQLLRGNLQQQFLYIIAQ